MRYVADDYTGEMRGHCRECERWRFWLTPDGYCEQCDEDIEHAD